MSAATRSSTSSTSPPAREAIVDLLTYLILVPGALLITSARAAGPGSVLRWVWRVDLACALAAVAWDVAAARPGAAMPLNRAVAIANILIFVPLMARDARSRALTGDTWIILSGATIFTGTALWETIRGFLGPAEPEPLAMATLVDAARRWVGADFAADVTIVEVDWIAPEPVVLSP